jgi:hypothetical protein
LLFQRQFVQSFMTRRDTVTSSRQATRETGTIPGMVPVAPSRVRDDIPYPQLGSFFATMPASAAAPSGRISSFEIVARIVHRRAATVSPLPMLIRRPARFQHEGEVLRRHDQLALAVDILVTDQLGRDVAVQRWSRPAR